MIPLWEPYINEYRNIRFKEDFPDARYIPKRSTVIKNKRRKANNKRRRKK